MKHYLGVDIGTFETKGVIVSATGEIVAQASRAHRMQVPQAGWAEHDAGQDWWGDFVFVTRKMLAESGIAPSCGIIRPMNSSLLSGLNPEQRKAVTLPHQSALIQSHARL